MYIYIYILLVAVVHGHDVAVHKGLHHPLAGHVQQVVDEGEGAPLQHLLIVIVVVVVVVVVLLLILLLLLIIIHINMYINITNKY